MYDIVIRNGTVLDGTGGEPFESDVAITGERIVEVGNALGSGREELDAKGKVVTPGFVDLHTHFDAQIGWDPMLTPVSWHGVTSALMGNCGVTFAPCHPNDRELLAGMMETVEDIPKDAILGGLPWDWEHYGEYLDSVESMAPAINIAGLVGHCALRFYVMGERAVEEQATPEERTKMATLAKDAVKAGALGFSTSRLLFHKLPDGRNIPGTHANHEELEDIAAAVGSVGGLMQNVANFRGDMDGEIDLLGKEARASGGKVLFSMTAGPNNEYGDNICGGVSELRKEGLDINAISIPRGSGLITGLACNLIWHSGPWEGLADMDVKERLVAIRDESCRAKLIAAAKKEVLAERGAIWRLVGMEHVVWLGDSERPNYVGGEELSLQGMADAAGEHPAETFLRMADESDGRALFIVRFLNQNDEALRRVLSHDFVMPGLGDAGAHVSQIMDSGWSTFVLSHWGRDVGFYALEQAIRLLTSAPARVLGLAERGSIKPGYFADINILDIDKLGERMPELVNDFPGGAKRFIQKAKGYEATICNGEVILRNDEHTGMRSGRILRH